MPVMVIVTGSPSGSVTPSMETSSNLWFGGHSCSGAGSATAAVQSGGWFPGCPGRVVVVVDEVVVVVVGGRVLVVVVLEVVVDGRVLVVVLEVVLLVVVVVLDVVVVVGSVVVVVGVLVVVLVEVVVVDVVVDPAPITDTLQPVPVAGRIATELVSKRVFTVRPMSVIVLAVAATLKVIMATLTTPVGDVRLELWKAERLVVPGVGVFVVGLPENWAVLPPATDATVRTAGSYVTAIE